MARPALVDDNALRMALIGYEQQKTRIEAAIADVHAQLGNSTPARTVTSGAAPKQRKMSAAARKRIALAQKQRWEAFRKAQRGAATATSADGKTVRKFGKPVRKDGKLVWYLR